MKDFVEYKGIKIGKIIFPDNTFVWDLNLNQLDGKEVTYSEVINYLESISPKEIKKYNNGTFRYIYK